MTSSETTPRSLDSPRSCRDQRETWKQSSRSYYFIIPYLQLACLVIASVAAVYDSLSSASHCGNFLVKKYHSKPEAGCINIQVGLSRVVTDLQLESPLAIPLTDAEGPAYSGWSNLNRWWDPRGHPRPWDDFCCTIVLDWETAREDFAAAQEVGNAATLIDVAEVLASPAYSYTQHLGRLLSRTRPTLWLSRLGFFCAAFGLIGNLTDAGVSISQRWWLAAGCCWLLVPILWASVILPALPPLYITGILAEYSFGLSSGLFIVGAVGLLLTSSISITRFILRQKGRLASSSAVSPGPPSL